MAKLTAEEEAVARNYNTSVFEYEAARLSVDHAVELALTTRYLERFVPANAVVADVGVGVGHYAEVLARHGCRIRLVDISKRLLDAATARLRAAGLAANIADATLASATHLDHIESMSCDAALFLGPLYHLPAVADREQAVREAARILRAGGVLFAAAINRLAYLRDSFRQSGNRGAELRQFHAEFLQDGNLDPDHAPPIAFAHLSWCEEFRSLFREWFDEVAYTGVESFTGIWGNTLTALSDTDAAAWLDLVEQTGTTPEGMGASDHLLFVGRKRG